MKQEFWRKKRVFLTGHTGFKGSWSTLWLKSLGAEVTGYSLEPPTQPSLFEIARVKEGIHSILGNVGDFALIKKSISEANPDIVIHMAAQSLVRESYKDPLETYRTNVLGTVHIFEAVRQLGIQPAVVSVTTDKCYENKEWLWGYRENEPLGGVDPYSSSKACAELVTSAYRHSFFNPADFKKHGVALASVRAGNVIGGGDWAKDRLVPDIMRSLMAQEEVVVRNPQSTRPWQHVLDPLHGYFTLAEKLFEDRVSFAEAWNFGPDESGEKSVLWIVEKLHQYWGAKASWQKDQGTNPHEANFLKLDCAKARNKLGWKPKLDLATALQWVALWYQAYQKKEDMRQFTERQIKQFMEMKEGQ